MASKSKAKAKTTASNANPAPAGVDMAAIVEATRQNSFLYHTAAAVAHLVAQGLVEQNPAMTDGQGGIATRATQKGIDSMSTAANTAADAASGQPDASAEQAGNGGGLNFTIDDNVPVPAVTGRGRSGQSSYPFDVLKVGQSFFVPKAAKNLASTVSGANSRHSEVIPGQFDTVEEKDEAGNVTGTKQVPKRRALRKFIVRSVTENGVKGSRIWRVEPNAA